MKKIILTNFSLILCFSTFFVQGQSLGDKIAPEIRAVLNNGIRSDVIVCFREHADLSRAKTIHGKSAKAQYVYQQLVETAGRSQANAIRLLRERQADANSFYLVNAIAVGNADAELINALAALPEVGYVAPDPSIHLPGPEMYANPVAERGAIEWGVQKINAPAVWALGYTGQGVTVGGADTGYDWMHPALKPHYRGYNAADGTADHQYNWHDAIHEISLLANDSVPGPFNNPCGLDAPAPCDDGSHGTHTMGTMTGNDNDGNQIGVAPGAKWIGCRNMERGNGKPSSYLECFQWFLAPTDLNNKNPDVTRAPAVINNSWYCSPLEGCSNPAIDELMRQAVINLRASGVVVVVSNGNFGGQGCASTYSPPAYFEESFSVGATESNDTIAGFSSRGPVMADGSFRLKPNVVAPGAAVRSSVPNNGYAHFWGTSMAGPHVVGLIALLLSAKPALAGEVDLIEDIIEQTAEPGFARIDCGNLPGHAYPNNTYGFGRVDALAAVQQALSTFPLSTAEQNNTLAVWIYPNPIQDDAVFDLQNAAGKTALELFSADGSRIFQKTWTAAHREFVQVSLSGRPKGVYFWKIRTENGYRSGKLARQ